MLSKKDRTPSTNFGYTFNRWNYKPPTDRKYVDESPFNRNVSTETVAYRSGIIFIRKNTIYNDIKVLVVRGKGTGIWSFPKGRMNENELEEVCAIREVYEETGIVVESLKDKSRFKIGRNTYFIIEVEDENQYKDFTIKDLFEIDVVEWKTLGELRKYDCNKDIRAILSYPEKKLRYHNLLL